MKCVNMLICERLYVCMYIFLPLQDLYLYCFPTPSLSLSLSLSLFPALLSFPLLWPLKAEVPSLSHVMGIFSSRRDYMHTPSVWTWYPQLLIDAVALAVDQSLYAPRQSTAQTVHVVSLIDLCTAGFET